MLPSLDAKRTTRGLFWRKVRELGLNDLDLANVIFACAL